MGRIISADQEKPRLDAEEKKAVEIKEYNDSLLEIEDEIKDLKGFNRIVLVRPFKLENIDDNGMVIPSKIRVPSQSGTKMVSEDNPYPYQERGVIVNIATDCPEEFTNVFNIGDVVLFSIKNFSQSTFQLDRRFPTDAKKDPKFTIMIHSSQITHKVGAS